MTEAGKMLEMAKKMAAAAEQKAIDIDVPSVITVVDKSGILVYYERMEDSLLASVEIAQNKAWTAAALKMPTSDVCDAAKESGPLFGLGTDCGCRIVTFGGGFPIFENGKIIGGIGVSGGTVEEDMSVAQAGLAAVGM
ncbi:MAG: GlcG/HbpS family heme-binding protein [Eubacteriaceae bacterium]|jgi:uncharacterized protein GlcG (DUF336 family)